MEKSNDTKQPGVLLRFDVIRNCTKRFDLEDKGRFFDAIMKYAEFNIVPDFSEEEDIMLCVAWDVIRPYIDKDGAKYRKKIKDSRDAANKRWGNQ